MTMVDPEPRPVDTAAALLGRVRLLELVARKNAAGLHQGGYRTAIRGRGMIYHESRKYVEGDPVRSIDWGATARVGEPYVKVHLEERQREVIVAVDVSPSMCCGSQAKTKLELAVELAATLATSAIAAGDRLGHVIFADEVLAESRPRGGKAQLFRTLRALLEHTAPWSRTVASSDPRVAIHAIERRRRGRFVVFLISDFVDHDVPDDLAYLRPRHDVSLLHVHDPLEHASTREVVLRGYAPEGGDPRRLSLRPDATGSLDETRDVLRRACWHHRLDLASFSTAESVPVGLRAFFHRKRRG